ncbi:hypothetical protein GCM10022409_31580 [Hymenobacter glaciei]|uniref:Carboxypeptidase regulatory-like domain-containing protein n=1 Tax=Hymenobacter glaciei TaxID=877209 RepID=A0ABP7UH27_9BACT
MKSARFLVVALLLHAIARVASAQAPAPKRTGSPPIDSVRVTFGPPEKTRRVEGYVLDKASQRPVPHVRVWRDDYPPRQARTDASGHFVLNLPAKGYNRGQLLTVQTLYYEGVAAIPADTTHPVKLLLKRNAYRFKPYGCQQLADTAHLSPYAPLPIKGLPATQYAFLIRDSSNSQPRQLRTVTIRVGRDGFTREPMRLRIYQYSEQLNAPPGDDLLRENVVMCPPKEGVFTYDVSSCDIVVPGTGFFLALEYTAGSDKFYCNDPLVDYTPTGPVLRPPCARTDIRTWERASSFSWARALSTENCWPLYESALSVELVPPGRRVRPVRR